METTQEPRYRSRALGNAHETIAGLYRLGLVDEAMMAEFDATCLEHTPTEDEERTRVLAPATVRG